MSILKWGNISNPPNYILIAQLGQFECFVEYVNTEKFPGPLRWHFGIHGKKILGYHYDNNFLKNNNLSLEQGIELAKIEVEKQFIKFLFDHVNIMLTGKLNKNEI